MPEPPPSTRRALQAFVARVGPDPRGMTAELDSAAAEVLEAFAAKGIGVLLLKGPALARLLYTSAEQRVYWDVDLLVAPTDLPRARATLAQLGYRNASEVLGIDDVGEAVHEESWIGRGPETRHEMVVELHLRLAGSKAPIQTSWDALRTRATTVELCGRRVPVLNREGLAMHLATHAAQHGPRYVKGCRELTMGLERWTFEIWERAAGLAAEIDATDAFAAGLRLVPAGAQLAETLDLPDTGRLDWEIRQAARPRGTFHLEALLGAQGLRARGAVLRRSLLPRRQWVVWQYSWAREGRGRVVAAYALHLMRTPVWAARAWRFRRRGRRRG